MSGKWKWVAVVLVVVLVGAGFYFGRPIVQSAGFAAEYVAKRACLCVFVSGRELVPCLIEMPEVVAAVEVEVLEEERAVRAWISFIAERTARYSEDSGCTLD
jgi:Ni,Fe-hydrogenase I cytochrome b subunit